MTQPSVALAPPDSPVPAPRGTTGAPNSRAGPHDVLHLVLGSRPHPGRGPPGRGPLRLVVRDGGEHVGIDDEPPVGQPAAECADQAGGVNSGGGGIGLGRVHESTLRPPARPSPSRSRLGAVAVRGTGSTSRSARMPSRSCLTPPTWRRFPRALKVAAPTLPLNA